VWCVLVAVDVIDGMTATTPGAWLGALLMLTFFAVASWRFFMPSPSISPVPLAALTATGAAVVAIHGGLQGFSVTEGLASWHAWTALAFLGVAASAAIAAPFTGIATPTIGELHFPMREGRWRVAAGQGRILNHHWIALDQREALDLVRIDWTRRSRRGVLGNADENFFAFGTAVVAPCTGTVIHAEDGHSDGVPDLVHAAGNHVIIDDGHEHVELAHLRLGTVTVSTGDRVHVGDRIGEIGNSGNSSEPHLHIQASRDGQPLRLRFIDVRGRLGRGRVVSP
jgi:hypothetical protein